MITKNITTICIRDDVKEMGKKKAEKRKMSFSQFIEELIKKAR